MGSNTENKIWYLARNGKRHGPLSDLEMSKLIEMGHLKAHDLVWRPGFQEWQSSSSVFSPSKTSPQSSSPPLGPKPQSQKVYDSLKETSVREKRVVTEPQKVPTQPTKKATPFKEEMFQWDIYYEGEDGPEFQNYKENSDDLEDVPLKRSFRKSIYAGFCIIFIGSISATGYFYYDQIRLASNFLIAQLTKIENPSPQSTSQELQSHNQTAALGSQSEVDENKHLEVQLHTRDVTLQKSSMWVLLKNEFPDWYKLQLSDIEKMEAEKRSEFDINKKLTESLVALRRLNAEKALSASSNQLQNIASTFINNLTILEKKNVEECYSFISNGELTPFAISMAQNPTEGESLHAQTEAVFRAILEGEKSPYSHEQPQKSDYSLLAKELANLGWSEADTQLFANPQILSNSPPAKVCKMVREWFSAHLSIKDNQARDRLLFETLRPLVAG